jgi:hypothetical protein
VSGTPAGAAASLARHLTTLADGLRTAAGSVPREVGPWSMPHAVLLRDMLGGSVEHLVATAEVCGAVAGALGVHAQDLTRAELMRRRAEALPAPERERVRQEARALEQASGRRLLAVVRPATAELPAPPRGPEAALDRVRGQAGSFALGALQSFASLLTPVRWVAEIPADPAGHAEQAAGALAATGRTLRHPGAWADLLDLDTLRDDPARWAGGLAPAVIGGSAASGGARRLFIRQLGERQARAQVRGQMRTDLQRMLTGTTSTEGRRVLVARAADGPRPAGEPWVGEGGRQLDPQRRAATDRLRDLSAAQAARLTAAMQELERRTGLILHGLETNVKGAESLRRKAADRFGRSPGAATAEILAGLDDIVRFTFEAPEGSYTAEVRRVTKLMEGKGFHLERVSNAWVNKKWSYRGVNTTWTAPDSGVRFELQFHTPASRRAGAATHGWYERWRLLPPKDPEARRLDALIRKEYAKAPLPAGIDTLPMHGYRPPADPDVYRVPTDLRVPSVAGALATGQAVTSGNRP